MLTVCGNLVVIISISHFKQLHTPTNFLVLSLAVADFLVGAAVMPFCLILIIETCWYFGDIFCMFYNLFVFFLTSVSICNVACIAIDRYFAVCYPLLYSTKVTVNITSSVISLTWLLSLLYNFAFMYFNGNIGGAEKLNICLGDCMLFTTKSWVIIDLIFTLILPCSLMIALYFKIFIVARKHARAISSVTEQMRSADRGNNKISTKSEWKAAKTLGILVIVFLLCLVPYYICCLVLENNDQTSLVLRFLGWLLYFNSAINPIIYAFPEHVVMLTVCGNLMVIISISHFKQLHTPTNFLVLSLAVADFLVGAAVMPFCLILFIETCWYFGETFCILYNVSVFFLTSVSIGNVACIAIDRYFAVCYPLLYSTKVSINITSSVILLNWLLSLLYNLAFMYFNGNIDVGYCFESNSSCLKEARSPAVYVVMYIFTVAVVMLTVCGNLVVIISISHFKQLHTPTNFLMLSLAVADFLVGAVVMPFSIILLIETCWYFGEMFCIIYKILFFFLISVSIGNVAFIAIDRYFVVCYPLLYSTKLHTPTNFLMLSLAVADFLIGVAVMPFSLILLIETCWYFGEIVCIIYKILFYIFTSVSIGNVAYIAIDRYFVVYYPLLYSTKLHSPTNFLMLSLAVADFLVGVAVMPFSLILLIETCWYFGETFCMLYKILFFIFTSVSIGNVAYIAIDRYFVVCYPLLYSTKITVNVTAAVILLNWLISLLYNFVFMYFNGNIGGVEKLNICLGDCVLFISKSWVIIDLLFTLILPSSVMITLYFKIFIVARKHAHAISSVTEQMRSADGDNNKISTKAEWKAAKTLGILVIVFLLCLVPYYICSLVLKNVDRSSLVLSVLGWFLYFNSAINPIIYALFYPWFQRSVKLIVTLKIFKIESSLINVFSKHI
ncbi:TAA7B protein, partial [Atractosteus spatula]|nr:TAA7B protein [Atractosteus spatula]